MDFSEITGTTEALKTPLAAVILSATVMVLALFTAVLFFAIRGSYVTTHRAVRRVKRTFRPRRYPLPAR